MFKNQKYSYLKQDLSMDCLLNVIDGVMETHGRLIFVTANDITPLAEMAAFLRPGRIDKQIQINYCDDYQFTKMVGNFYQSEDITWAGVVTKLKENQVVCPISLSAAMLVEKMQRSNTLDDFIDLFQKDTLTSEWSEDLNATGHN